MSANELGTSDRVTFDVQTDQGQVTVKINNTSLVSVLCVSQHLHVEIVAEFIFIY